MAASLHRYVQTLEGGVVNAIDNISTPDVAGGGGAPIDAHPIHSIPTSLSSREPHYTGKRAGNLRRAIDGANQF